MAFGKEEQRMDASGNEKDGCTRRIVKGLENVGNSCFFNSVIQNLLAVDLLRDHFMKPTQFLEGPITSALRKLYVETSTDGSKQGGDINNEFTWWNEGNEAVNPAVLFTAICAKVPQFRGFGQQDSHELLRCLLDNLHTEELLNFSNSKPTNCGDGEAAEGNSDESSNQRNDATLVDRVFEGQLCSTVSCSKCGYHSITYEPFLDLPLPIPRIQEPMKVLSPRQKDPPSSTTKLKNGVDNPLSATGTHDWLYEYLLDTAENVRVVENLFAEDTAAKSEFDLLVGSESPLPYKEVDSVVPAELEVTHISTEFNTDEALAKQLGIGLSSIMGIDPNDDIWNIFDDNEISVVQEEKIEVGESENLLNGENDGDNLFKSVSFTTETRDEETEAAVIPISVDGCLVEFTRPELLSGANGWKCPNCASKLVNGSDNQENMTANEEQSMGFNGMLNAGSLQNTSYFIKDQNPVGKPNLLKRVKGTELEVFTSARLSETSDTKTDEFQLHSGSVTGSGAGLNDNECRQTEVLCSLNDIDNAQPSNQEGLQMRRGFAGKDSVLVHDSSSQGVSCSHGEGHSNKNERILGAEDSSEIDGISHAERSASTGLEEEGGRISANWGEMDLEPQKLTSSVEVHRPKKRKSRTIEHEANSDGIVHEATKIYLISNAPPILTIHLKRFENNFFGSISKLSGHVAFQERFDLRPYLDTRCHDKHNCIYRLIGVVEHEGNMEFGHYVAYVRCDQDGSVFHWFYVSDSHVKQVSLREVLESEAYILFYEKCKL